MRKYRILGGLLAALMLCAAFAASAGAAPAWKFNGKALEGTETILGGAEKSGLTMWGFTTTCDNFLYEVDIKNEAGTGKGNITSLPLFGCYTNSTCTVEAIEAETFPWPSELKTVGGSNYLVVKGVGRLGPLRRLVLPAVGRLGPRHRNGRRPDQQHDRKRHVQPVELQSDGNLAEIARRNGRMERGLPDRSIRVAPRRSRSASPRSKPAKTASAGIVLALAVAALALAGCGGGSSDSSSSAHLKLGCARARAPRQLPSSGARAPLLRAVPAGGAGSGAPSAAGRRRARGGGAAVPGGQSVRWRQARPARSAAHRARRSRGSPPSSAGKRRWPA